MTSEETEGRSTDVRADGYALWLGVVLTIGSAREVPASGAGREHSERLDTHGDCPSGFATPRITARHRTE